MYQNDLSLKLIRCNETKLTSRVPCSTSTAPSVSTSPLETPETQALRAAWYLLLERRPDQAAAIAKLVHDCARAIRDAEASES